MKIVFDYIACIDFILSSLLNTLEFFVLLDLESDTILQEYGTVATWYQVLTHFYDLSKNLIFLDLSPSFKLDNVYCVIKKLFFSLIGYRY